MGELFSFPDPVNDKAARTVAAGVLTIVFVLFVTGWWWLTIPLCYGFWARLLTGPTLSPLGRLAMDVVAPRLGERRPVPGPPKRFAQGIGAALSSGALLLGLVLGDHLAAEIVLAMFIPAAGLEAGFGYCLGCKLFGVAMAVGLVPEDVCVECADLRLHWSRPSS